MIPSPGEYSLPPSRSAEPPRALVDAAQRFRRAIERYAATTEAPELLGFPRGMCGYASKLLARHLEEQGLGPATLIANACRGDRASWQTHAWLEVGGWFVDITADQFGDAPGTLVVAPGNRFHRTFRGAGRYPFAEMTWNNEAGERFACVYAAILQHLDEDLHR